MKLGGIDIGSNAMRLLVGEVLEKENQVHISKLSMVRLPVRLGADVFSGGLISQQKESDFIKGMEVFKAIMEIHNVDGHVAKATSAMRNASNGPMVAQKVKDKTGIDIEIIDGDKEANIILSTFHLLKLEKNKPYLYIDVGGGSTEISLLMDGEAKASHSFKVGTVRILQDELDPNMWKEMSDWTSELKLKYSPEVAIGSGGNINKIIKLCCGSDTTVLDIERMKALLSEMEEMTVEERMIKWDLRSDRADVIVPASKIYLNVLDRAGINTIIIPKIGLADGLLYSLYNKLSKK